jgi:lysophospholipid acyltransferase (LPLAT)-like uncharacterized protein
MIREKRGFPMVVRRGPSNLSGESLKLRFLIDVVGPMLYRIITPFYLTTKKYYINRELEALFTRRTQPVIWAHYHYWDIFYFFNFQNRHHTILCGDRWGGMLGAKLMAKVGIETVRRTTRTNDPKSPDFISGAEALDELIRMVREEEFTAAMSVDGPRGPIFTVKWGVIDLAERTGAPILTMSVATYPRVTVNTWDKMPIPLPFQKIVYLYGGPFFVPKGASQKTREKVRTALEAHMKEVKDFCEWVSGRRETIDALILGSLPPPSLDTENTP